MQTPRDERAAARDDRRNLLEIPVPQLGRGEIIRSRSPSPAAAAPGLFNFPPTAQRAAAEEQFEDARAIPNGNMAYSEEDVRRITAAAVESALRNANTQQQNACAGRKPDLPPFDGKRIEEWLRRVENAYIRSSITTPADKFAFLEGKISVEQNPKINEFFNGPATEDNWTAFTNYLKKEYGRTRQQQASTLIDGVKRDGRRPSQLFAQIKDLSKDATLDDVRKELLMREMPVTVRSALAEKIETMTGEEAATAADHYFDRNGKFMHATQMTVNQVGSGVQNGEVESGQSTQQFTAAFSDIDDSADVNAIRPPFRGRSQSRNQRGMSQVRFSNSGGNNNGSNRGNQGAGQATGGNKRFICSFHRAFKDSAKSCRPGCEWVKGSEWAKGSQGNGNPGRRM